MSSQTLPIPQPTKPERRLLEAERSIAGTVVRRWNFFHRYLRARQQRRTLQKFLPILAHYFDNPWLEGVRLRLRLLPGNEEREFCVLWRGGNHLLRFRWLPWRDEQCYVHWTAPITVALLKKGKPHAKPETVRYMALFIQDDFIHIWQLQGVALTDVPQNLLDWAERLVKATMQFVCEENFRGVRIARAESLYSYHHPTLRENFSPDEHERELKRIRANIRLHHNQTAFDLGFRPQDDWFMWQNPNYKPH